VVYGQGKYFHLQWSDVDQVNGFITLRDTKSGKTRTVHMPLSVKEIIGQ